MAGQQPHSQLWPCHLTVGVRTVLQNGTSVLYIDDTMFSRLAEHEVSQEALVSTCVPEDRRLTPVKNQGPHISENSRVQSSRARQDLPWKVTGRLLHVIPSIMKRNFGQSIFLIQEYRSNPETGSHTAASFEWGPEWKRLQQAQVWCGQPATWALVPG